MAKSITAGIDTSKAKLDVAIHGQKQVKTLSNDAAGWSAVVAYLADHEVGRVGIEATGGYELGVVRHLESVGFQVLRLQPLQVKAFAQMHLQRAKTDRIDAQLIAACTHLFEGRKPRLASDARIDPLAEHLTFIEQIDDDLVRFKTRLEHIHDPARRRLVQTDIRRAERRLATHLKQLEAEVRVHADLAGRLDLVESIPGIGMRTALSIIIRLPELGKITREEIASLAGLAPFVRQSGKRKGEAHIGGGRARLRTALYAAALPASCFWNPALVKLRNRMKANGKGHRAIMVACARKLIIYANTVAERGTPWTPRTATVL